MVDPATVVSGVSCLIAAVALGVRHAALGRKNETWPDAPPLVRGIMFMFMLALVWRGLHALFGADLPANRTPPEASISAVLLAVYMTTMAINVIRQNYPTRVWTALNKIQRLAACGDGKSSAPEVVRSGVEHTLEAEGFEVMDHWNLQERGVDPQKLYKGTLQ